MVVCFEVIVQSSLEEAKFIKKYCSGTNFLRDLGYGEWNLLSK